MKYKPEGGSLLFSSYLVPSPMDLPQARHLPRKGEEVLPLLGRTASRGTRFDAVVNIVAVPDEVDGGGAEEQLTGDFVLGLHELCALHVSEYRRGWLGYVSFRQNQPGPFEINTGNGNTSM